MFIFLIGNQIDSTELKVHSTSIPYNSWSRSQDPFAIKDPFAVKIVKTGKTNIQK